MKPSGYIVAYVDDAMVVPYEWDADCEGALKCMDKGPVVVFPDKSSAIRAIIISRKFAELEKAQGKPHNDDFTNNYKQVNVIPVCNASEAKP